MNDVDEKLYETRSYDGQRQLLKRIVAFEIEETQKMLADPDLELKYKIRLKRILSEYFRTYQNLLSI